MAQTETGTDPGERDQHVSYDNEFERDLRNVTAKSSPIP
jgi:hypothetical protein